MTTPSASAPTSEHPTPCYDARCRCCARQHPLVRWAPLMLVSASPALTRLYAALASRRQAEIVRAGWSVPTELHVVAVAARACGLVGRA